VAGRFEAAHPPPPLAGGLVRVLGAVVEPLVLAMLDSWQQLCFRCPVALELIGDQDPWDVVQPLEQLAENCLAALSRCGRTRMSKTRPS